MTTAADIHAEIRRVANGWIVTTTAFTKGVQNDQREMVFTDLNDAAEAVRDFLAKAIANEEAA